MPRKLSIMMGILCLIAVSSCNGSTPPSSRGAQAFNAAATQAALNIETEIARPTYTPTLLPSATPTPSSATFTATPLDGTTPTAAAIRVTAMPGLELYTFPEIPDYVFQIDPSLWEKDPQGTTSDLVKKADINCRLGSVPGSGLGTPQRLLWEDFGRFRWEIQDFGAWALVSAFRGSGLSQADNSYLLLKRYSVPACRSDQEELLANAMTLREAAGEVKLALYSSPTPRPALQGFSCPDTPPARLRIGDIVAVVTDGLWLRSAPSADDSTKVRKLLRNPGTLIEVTGGPVCEKYVYWEVRIAPTSSGGESTKGWLAEGDLQEIYLKAVN